MLVHSLRGYTLEVPELTVGKRFYSDVGLDAKEEKGRVTLRCQNINHNEVILVQGGDKKKLHHITLGANEDALAGIQLAAEKNDVKIIPAPSGFDTNGLWLQDSFGLLIHIEAADKPAPLPPVAEFKMNLPGRIDRPGTRNVSSKLKTGPLKPKRLGHILMFTPDVRTSINFFKDILGFKLSDWVEDDVIAFMHCPGGSDHHVVAFAKSNAVGLHHGSFEMASPDELGLAGDRMAAKGYAEGWGFGRHTIGSNFFQYVRDPWDSYVEYYCDMDYVPSDQEWPAREWPQVDALHNWGPLPPEDFVNNYES
jgi:catechol 2,3-dioxygenase